MMIEKKRFYFKYCGTGHMLYSIDSPPSRLRCTSCGERYLESCSHCNKSIGNSFLSSAYLSTGAPVHFPKRPDFCENCGNQWPWISAKISRVIDTGVWSLLHPKVIELAKPRFESGQNADAVEAVFKEINVQVKAICLAATGEEHDGVNLMRKAFAPTKPIIKLEDLSTESGRSIQQGFLEIFAGVISAIRNPKAHGNVSISAEIAIHYLMLGSLLLYKIDERK